jgi:Glyoxalase-like domain
MAAQALPPAASVCRDRCSPNWLQQVAEHIPPQWPGQERPQQVHLDLLVDGHEEAAQRAVALGATRLADGASYAFSVTLTTPALNRRRCRGGAR